MAKKLEKKKVFKKTVKDLMGALKGVDPDKEIILGFHYKGEVHHVYLAEILTDLKYDGVIKETLEDASVVEFSGFDDEYCIYGDKK